MINVIAPPGCYGTYISRCLYHYTNLGFTPGWTMDFDPVGSSHSFRSMQIDKIPTVANQHHDTCKTSINKSNNIVVYADTDHCLDYYDNQFIKQEQGLLVRYLFTSFTIDEISRKLETQWGYVDPLTEEIPSWITREFISFWLQDVLADGYDKSKYLDLPHIKSFSCQELFEQNYFMTIWNLCDTLNLELLETLDNIQHNHMKFLSAQQFHNMQIKCETFVRSCIDTTDYAVVQSPCVTIIDEAFVQCRLRELGWEIRCDELHVFPDNSSQLRLLMYPT